MDNIKKKKHIKLLMNTTIQKNGEKEQFSLRGEGIQYKKGGFTYVVFQEFQSDGSKVNTIVKIGENEVTLLRKGAISMRQTYRLGEKIEGKYTTPYGSWETIATTSQLRCMTKTGSYQLLVQYEFELQGEHLGTYEWLLIVEEDKKDE